MAGNSSLNAAAHDKNDEFYTRLADIEKELRHYRKHFKGVTVLCNCDDPFESNFFKYFVLNFNRLGLKKLIATCYVTSPIAGQHLSLFDVMGGEDKQRNKPYKAVVTKVYDVTGDGGIDMFDVAELFKAHENELVELDGDGDFRSEECLALLDEADIVVTNPPFSLFREYVAVLVEHKKKFIIIGNQNATKYKEIFPLMMGNEIWLGNNNPAPKLFYVPSEKSERKNIKVDEDGKLVASFGNICWFTNLDIKKRHETMILVKRYLSDEYPTYENYDAIEVSKVSDIPCDYEGLMGVPITYLGQHNPEQFEIAGLSDRDCPLKTKVYTKAEYANYSDLNRCCVIRQNDGTLKSTYMRIFIRHKHPEQSKVVQQQCISKSAR